MFGCLSDIGRPAMNVLDGDGVKLRSGARIADRDIVQFVP